MRRTGHARGADGRCAKDSRLERPWRWLSSRTLKATVETTAITVVAFTTITEWLLLLGAFDAGAVDI